MRYKSCTAADIAFLHTHITSDNPNRPSITDNEFCNVFIITAFNTHKDSINTIGLRRFATEKRVKLTDFFSDNRVEKVEDRNKKKGRKIATNCKISSILDNLQQLLWDTSSGTVSDFIPEKLSLCLDLPVMIWANAVTDLCITKSQEGTVYAWQSRLSSQGQQVLDTLFIKLTNPPQNIKLDGLLENVIPLVPNSNSVECCLPDDSTVRISRTQVKLIPNFAMTDFASQGKTRHYNFIDLNNLSCHQAYYMALSQSASATRTIILQAFNEKVMTGGVSSALQQEFRNLEILDAITQLRFESQVIKNSVW